MPARIDVAIVGGGIAGLCVADRLRRDQPDAVVRVYEASDRAGGKLLTERIEAEDGVFLVEAGADAWLAQKPWAAELVDELGLSDQVIPIARLPKPVAILKGGRFVDLPAGVSLVAPARLWPVLRSRLLSPRGVLRAAGDLVIRSRAGDADESLGGLVERRLGREALDWIAEPIAAGIYNADPQQMSLLATFPQLRKLEREHGSVIRGLRLKGGGWRERKDVVAGLRTRLVVAIRNGRWNHAAISNGGDRDRPGINSRAQRRKSAEADSAHSLGEALSVNPGFGAGEALDKPLRAPVTIRFKTGPHPALSYLWERVLSFLRAAGLPPHAPTERSPTFLTLRDGMGTLADALAERVSDVVETGVPVAGIVAEPTGGYWLRFADRAEVLAERVVLTVPARIAAELLVSVAPEAADRLRELRAVHAGTISLAYRTPDISRTLPGYGLVIPKREGRAINAITVASRKFGGRGPAGWELLRVFFGGYRSPATMELDDDALLETVTAELRDLLGITAPPAFHRIHRWPAGSPQYDVGHLKRVAAIEAALPEGITIIGSPYRGVGLPDVINAAWLTAAGIASGAPALPVGTR